IELFQFDRAIKDYSTALLEKKYVAAARHLEKARSSLKVLESRKGFELKVLKALGTELTVQTQNMLYHLGEEWRQMVLWKLPPSKEISSAETVMQMELHLCTMPLKEDQISGPPVASVLQAFAVLGELHTRLKLFGKTGLCVPLKRETFCGANLDHPSPVEVYGKITLPNSEPFVFFLLNPDCVSRCVWGNEKDSRVVLAEMLGDMVWRRYLAASFRNVLGYSIPANSSQTEQYVEVIKSTEDFEKHLKNMGFLKGDATDLLKYARNVNSHFANKICQDVIVAARKLMTSEIHNTVKITPDSSVAIPKLPDSGAGDHLKMHKASKMLHNELINLESETRLSQHTFSLPTCHISVSVEKLRVGIIDLQPAQISDQDKNRCLVHLFYSVRNIFHLFYDVCFLATMRGAAKERLWKRLVIVKGIYFSNMAEENCSAANKQHKVLHQLKRLGKVWQDVLPVNIYCKAMGTLLNTALSEIINRITALEDISAEDADRLHSLCRIMLEEGPLVFTPLLEENKNKKYQEEVPIYVQKWMMFQELMIILQANLQEIVDR
uniref:Zw10 kinetochore protein n=1 Tax=Chelonoidis abingdonii TaxID=106734 RepID=A0A8C0J578_CHEAB